MFSLILHHGRKSLTLQKWRNFRVSKFIFLSNSFSSATAAAIVSPRDVSKGKNFTVSYLVESLGLSTKLAESISRKVSFEESGNTDSVLSLLRSYGFTDSQISNIITNYPRLLVADAKKNLAPKLKFLQSRGASTSELTEVLSKVPKILRKGNSISVYYEFVKAIVVADESSEYENLCHSSLPEGSRQENKIRNILVLRELGMPQKLLFSMLLSNLQTVSGKERFEESLKKVVELGFDPTTSRFVQALHTVYQMTDKTIDGKVNAVCKRLGFAMGDVWEMFKKHPSFLTLSEKKILNSIEAFLCLGFSRDEVAMMVKCRPQFLNYSAESVKKKTEFLVKKMNWPLKDVALFPHVFSYSMEKRIVPRCKVIKALMSKRLLGSELPSIPSVLVCTDEAFLERYVMKPDDKELVAELMAICTGDRVP